MLFYFNILIIGNGCQYTCVIFTMRQHYLNWTILSVENELWSIKDFFDCSVKPRLRSAVNTSSVTACVGSDKSSLDSVDTDLQLVLVIKSFGHFLKSILLIQTLPQQL